VVVDQFHVEGRAILEVEDDAPIGADRDAPEAGEFALQLMQAVARC